MPTVCYIQDIVLQDLQRKPNNSNIAQILSQNFKGKKEYLQTIFRKPVLL